MEILVLLVLW